MTEKELLEEQLKQLNNITPETLSDWKSETLPIISEIFGEKSHQFKQFAMIGYLLPQYTNSEINDFKNCLSGLIKCLIIRNDNKHIRPNSNKNQVVINNNPQFSQSQTQTQTQTMDIKDIIKDELPPAKMREIEKILKTEEPELEKVGEVLQKVGIGVTSSVLARIITNSIGIF